MFHYLLSCLSAFSSMFCVCFFVSPFRIKMDDFCDRIYAPSCVVFCMVLYIGVFSCFVWCFASSMAVLSRTLLPSTESPTILASTFYAKLYARVTPSFSLCYLRFSIFNSTHLLMVPPRHFSPGSYIITRFFLSLLIRYLILTVSILHFFCSGIAMLSVLFFFSCFIFISFFKLWC